MKKYLLILFIATLPALSQEIEKCPQVDFWKNYPKKVTNQYGAGICSTLAVSNLISEFICVVEGAHCNSPVIPASTTVCEESKQLYLDKTTGIIPQKLLECIAVQGVYLTSNKAALTPSSFGTLLLNDSGGGSSSNPYLKLYNGIKKKNWSLSKVRRYLGRWGFSKPYNLAQNTQSFREEKISLDNFIVAITSDKEHVFLSDFEFETFDIEGKDSLHEDINEIFMRTHRGVLAVYGTEKDPKNGNSHAVVINGQRFNEKENRCEYLVLDSSDENLYRWESSRKMNSILRYVGSMIEIKP